MMGVKSRTSSDTALVCSLIRQHFHLPGGQDGALKLAQVESALDEMLFSGGSLNVKLLGGAVQGDSAE